MKKTCILLTTVLLTISVQCNYSQSQPPFHYKAAHFGITNEKNTFSFAIIADPQVKADENGPMQSNVMLQNARNLENTIREINNRENPVDFIIVAGDMVGSPTEHAFAYYRDIISESTVPVINVHGNHDGNAPYKAFIEYLAKPVNNLSTAFFSFDVGRWHFISIPCSMDETYFYGQLLPWLQEDLAQNKHKPCMVVLHEPLLPVGLTQLEFYTYQSYQRKAILNEIVNHGNVKYVFYGHVHTGILSSVKTSWTYKGVNFINCPTGTWSRNFGEEFDDFHEGFLYGGYYLVAHVDGEHVKLTGKCNNVEHTFYYPAQFQEYSHSIEPRWETPVSQWEPAMKLHNGDFGSNLDHWHSTYRYRSESNPGFEANVTQSDAPGNGKSLQITTREKGSRWAADELMELYQVVDARDMLSPIVQLDYKPLHVPGHGGFYVKIAGFSDNELTFLMVLDNANDRYNSIHFPRSTYFSLTHGKTSARILHEMGRDKMAMFGRLTGETGKWAQLRIDLEDAYNQVHENNRFCGLETDKLYIAIGSWTGSIREGGYSSALFDNILIKNRTYADMEIPVFPLTFETDYGGRIVNMKK